MKFIEIIKGNGLPAHINTEAITAVESEVDGWTVIRLGARSYYTHEPLGDFLYRLEYDVLTAPKGDQ